MLPPEYMFWATIAVAWFGVGALIWFALMKAGRRLVPQTPVPADVFVEGMWGGTATIGSNNITATVMVRNTSTEDALSAFAD
jgi:hypothetical protein